MDLSFFREQNNAFYPLSVENHLRLEACCYLKKLKKGNFFIEIGHYCKEVGFINQGILRSFLYVDNTECTYEFFPELTHVTDYESLVHQSPASFSIEALEDCELICLRMEDLAALYKHSVEFQLLVKAIIEKRFMQMLNLSRVLRFQNPQKRYTTFLQHFPTIPNRVPQYMIASYLGIKPETLSRVRNRLSKSK